MLDSIFRELAVSGNLNRHFKLKNKNVFDDVNRDKFSEQTKINRTTLYAILRGNTCLLSTAEKISEGLGSSLDKVFDDVTEDKGLSGASVNKIKLNLSAIFTAAVKKEIIRRNPCKLVTPPKVDTEPAAFLDEEQSRILLDSLHQGKNFQLEVIVNLLLATGIRAGECTALHWEDVNLETGVLQVRHTLVRYNHQFVRQKPKTEQSERRIILPLYIVKLLTEHKARQEKYIASLEEVSLYKGQVFTNLRGDYLNQINLNVQLKRAIKGLNLPDIHLHSLRHPNHIKTFL